MCRNWLPWRRDCARNPLGSRHQREKQIIPKKVGHCQSGLGESGRYFIQVFLFECTINILDETQEFVSITIRVSPHKFSKIACMVSEMCTISWHLYFSMSPVTFNGVCAGLCFFINKFLRVVNCYVSIAHRCQFIVCLPAVTVDNGTLFYPFLNER